jgi:Na+(H+)/acetate symporter ActP
MSDALDELMSELVRHPNQVLQCNRKGDEVAICFRGILYVTTPTIAAGIASILLDESNASDDSLAVWLASASKVISDGSGGPLPV